MRGRPLRALVFAFGLALTACQATPSQSPRPTPSPAPDARLQAADSRLYAGDYDGAEAAYRQLAAAHVKGAAAHYSTLLAYESRFQEAVAQARAGVEQSPDSDSLARLARALDWAEDLAAAQSAGARAVSAQPVAPLAHVFYAEALSDAGRFTEAERELRAGEKGGGDAYVRAELAREWANYWRGRKNPQSELNYALLARKEQPKFPERTLELARYDFLHSRREAAQMDLDKVRAAFPANSAVLLAGGDVAFLGGDLDRARQLYEAAAQLSSAPARAALSIAELDVAVRRDFRAAHDRLIEALRRDPGSGPLYQYLRHLDLLVLNTDPDAELRPITSQPPSSMGAARKAALEAANSHRTAVGVPALVTDPALDAAALAHAYYFMFNYGRPQLAGLGVHSEESSQPAFTGVNSLERARHFGYQGTRGAEVINHVFTPEASVRVWIDSVFHRFPLLDPESKAIGYGEAQIGTLSVAVMDIGLGSPGKAGPIVFPAPGRLDIPPAFTGNEIPDPAPEGAAYPLGYPVTLQVGGAQALSIRTARLLDPDGREVPSYVLPPGQKVSGSEWALLAQKPLELGRSYTAEVIGQLDGQDFSRRWSFTVAAQ